MNNRDYKAFASGEYYHIYNRGNGKMDIFKDEQDYLNFLKRLKIVLGLQPTVATRVTLANKQGSPLLRLTPFPTDAFTVPCYCLMPNHFHLLIRQNSDLPLTKLIAKVSTSYSMYFNRKYNRVGSLFQDTFKAINVAGDPYLLWLSAYIHNNPKTAGLVRNIDDWQWSSYPDYAGKRQGKICDTSLLIEMAGSREDFIISIKKGGEAIALREELSELLLD